MTATVLHIAEQAISHCQRRLSTKKTKRKPAMLHFRKPSLSNSVSSAASSSTSSTHSEAMHRHDPVVEFDPLLMHPAFAHPPARLQDRPYIALYHDDEEPPMTQEEEDEWRFLMGERGADEVIPARKATSLPLETPTPMAHTGHERQKSEFIDDDEEDDESTEEYVEEQAREEDVDETQDEEEEATDYFMMKTYRRRQPARSHWSESTIQTLDFSATPAPAEPAQTSSQLEPQEQQQEQQSSDDDDDDDEELDRSFSQRASNSLERQIRQTRYQNFSYKRNTVPRRPPIKTVDSIENFIKRGGWKRRGIVFQQDPERPLSDVDVSPQPQLA